MKPYRVLDAIEDLKEIAVEVGNIEVMAMSEIDENLVAHRGYSFHVVEYETEDGVQKTICGFGQDLDSLEPIDPNEKKRQGMN